MQNSNRAKQSNIPTTEYSSVYIRTSIYVQLLQYTYICSATKQSSLSAEVHKSSSRLQQQEQQYQPVLMLPGCKSEGTTKCNVEGSVSKSRNYVPKHVKNSQPVTYR